jgi:hypothetical protein
VTVVSLPARGRPPQAAARRAGLEFVEKLLTDSMLGLLDGAEPSMHVCLSCPPLVTDDHAMVLGVGPGTAASFMRLA